MPFRGSTRAVTMAVALRSASVLTFSAFGVGGHGLDEEGADAMRQRLLALESEAGEMRRQLESLGIVAQGDEAETRFAGVFQGAASELLVEFAVLLGLGLIVYAVSRGSSVPPASKGKEIRAGPAGFTVPRPLPRALHAEPRQPPALREKPAQQGAGNDAVWAALQKVTARHKIGDEIQAGNDLTSDPLVDGSCNVSEPAPRISLRPSWAPEPAEKVVPQAQHPWSHAKQEMKAAGAEAYGLQPEFSVEKTAEPSLPFMLPPGLTLPVAETTQPLLEQNAKPGVEEQDSESIVQTTEDVGNATNPIEDIVPMIAPDDLVELDEKQEQQTKEEAQKDDQEGEQEEEREVKEEEQKEDEEEEEEEEASIARALLSSTPPAQETTELFAKDQTPQASSTRKGRTRKSERSSAQRPAQAVMKDPVAEDDWVQPSPSLLARLRLMLAGFAPRRGLLADQSSHAAADMPLLFYKHGSKKGRAAKVAKEQRPAKAKVEQAPRWSLPRWPLGTTSTLIVAVLCGIVICGRVDWDMDDVTRLRKLSELKEKHRRATEQLIDLRAQKAALGRARALAELAIFVGDASEVLDSMQPEERSEAARLEGYQSDAKALLEAMLDIGEEEFPQVADTYTQVSEHWQMVLKTERAKQKKRKVLSEEGAAFASPSNDEFTE